MSCPEDNSIVLSYHDSLLKQSDIDLLDGPHWLNDQLISFFFEYLSRDLFKEQEETFLFVTPEVTQCLKLVSPAEVAMFLSPLNAKEKKIVFFALNDNANNAAGGSHWSLLVFSKPAERFYHFDSSTPSNFHVGESMVEKLQAYFECPQPVLSLKECKCLQQSNSYDCGVHVLAQTEFLAKQISKSQDYNLDAVKMAPKQSVTHKREHVLSIIESLSEGDY